MPEYRVTFGNKYRHETHPTYPGAHPDGWVAIHAGSEESARETVVALLAGFWSCLHAPGDPGYPDVLDYPRGPLLTIMERGWSMSPVSYRGETMSNSGRQEVLVTIWPDGQGTIVSRPVGEGTWGAPVFVAPVES